MTSSTTPETPETPEDTSLLEETAIAIAQAEICGVMRMTSTTKTAMAKKLGMSCPAVTRALKGDHNLTIRTMARLFAACGYEVRFVAVPITTGGR